MSKQKQPPICQSAYYHDPKESCESVKERVQKINDKQKTIKQ